jgi:hypothetical protein
MVKRIGGGSYERPNREQSKTDLRNRFFEAVNMHAMHVLEDLCGEPLRLYIEAGLSFNVDTCENDTNNLNADEKARKRAREWTKHRWNRPEWQPKFENGPIAYDTRKEAFRQSLFEWSRRNHLDAVWCRERAYETLDNWSISLTDREQLQFQPIRKMVAFFPLGGGAKGLQRRLTFDYVVAHPQIKAWEQTEAELREAFDRELNAISRDIKSRSKANGYVLTPEEYRTKKHSSEDRFRWLVERIVNEKSLKTILDELDPKHKDSLDHSTVRKTIKALAEAIKLPHPPTDRP